MNKAKKISKKSRKEVAAAQQINKQHMGKCISIYNWQNITASWQECQRVSVCVFWMIWFIASSYIARSSFNFFSLLVIILFHFANRIMCHTKLVRRDFVQTIYFYLLLLSFFLLLISVYENSFQTLCTAEDSDKKQKHIV